MLSAKMDASPTPLVEINHVTKQFGGSSLRGGKVALVSRIIVSRTESRVGRLAGRVGKRSFFAIYHPPRSWLPVGLLGVATALVFKKTGRLAPSVILHTVYNAVVSGFA